MQIPDVNLDTITDAAARHLIGQLLNLIETLAAENQALCVENQQLRDELARLKGGSGKPSVKPPTDSLPTRAMAAAIREVYGQNPIVYPTMTVPMYSVCEALGKLVGEVILAARGLQL